MPFMWEFYVMDQLGALYFDIDEALDQFNFGNSSLVQHGECHLD